MKVKLLLFSLLFVSIAGFGQDEFDLNNTESCEIPTVLSASTTTNSSNVRWNANPNAVSFTLIWREVVPPMFTWDIHLHYWREKIVYTNSANISGLKSGTTYECKVSANCPEGSSNFSLSSYFVTLPMHYDKYVPDSLQFQNNNYFQVYPNPTSGLVNLSFVIPESSGVEITVYDNMGKSIAVILNEYLEAGAYTRTYDLDHVPAGNYVCRITTNSNTESIKLIKE